MYRKCRTAPHLIRCDRTLIQPPGCHTPVKYFVFCRHDCLRQGAVSRPQHTNGSCSDRCERNRLGGERRPTAGPSTCSCVTRTSGRHEARRQQTADDRQKVVDVPPDLGRWARVAGGARRALRRRHTGTRSDSRRASRAAGEGWWSRRWSGTSTAISHWNGHDQAAGEEIGSLRTAQRVVAVNCTASLL